MAGKTIAECLENMESEMSQLRKLSGEEQSPEEESEISGTKMVGRGRKRHQRPTFEKSASDDDGDE